MLLESAEAGDRCCGGEAKIEIREPIEFAHKVALRDISAEETIFKYGEDIGYALRDIPKGAWIHVHNMGCRRGK